MKLEIVEIFHSPGDGNFQQFGHKTTHNFNPKLNKSQTN